MKTQNQPDKPQNPKHNRMKLVFGPNSSWYIEHSEARRIFQILKALKHLEKQEENGWVKVKKLYEHLKLHKSIVNKQLRYICGVQAIYMYQNGREERIAGKLIELRRDMHHPLKNIHSSMGWLTGPSYVRSARL